MNEFPAFAPPHVCDLTGLLQYQMGESLLREEVADAKARLPGANVIASTSWVMRYPPIWS